MGGNGGVGVFARLNAAACVRPDPRTFGLTPVKTPLNPCVEAFKGVCRRSKGRPGTPKSGGVGKTGGVGTRNRGPA
jgi:hypothetical protein